MTENNLSRITTEDGRVYTNGSDLFLPSVTTILSSGEEPEGIKIWKQRNDGTGDSPHWQDILQYKSNRGTLIHYNLLNEFAEEDMYSDDEDESTEELKLEGNWSRYTEDLAFAEEAWEEIKRVRGIDEESVIDVECFVTNVGVGYAGQFDLLYIDDDSNVVLADLKTGKGIYPKYKKQLVAYENAINLDIDRIEIIRIYPDDNEWEVSHDGRWYESRDELWNEFVELRSGMEDVQERMEAIVDADSDEG